MKLPIVLIFMGVSGCGKTTVAKLFAEKTGAIFYEGDDFHPPENVKKMRQGMALTDGDREKWLQTLREVIARSLAKRELAGLTCSALKAGYRAQLQGGEDRVKFVYLQGTPELIEARLNHRQGHFMPPSLLASQFAILEPPKEALTFSCEEPPEKIVAKLIQALRISR